MIMMYMYNIIAFVIGSFDLHLLQWTFSADAHAQPNQWTHYFTSTDNRYAHCIKGR